MIQYIITDMDRERCLASMGQAEDPKTWKWREFNIESEAIPANVCLFNTLGYAKQIAFRMSQARPRLRLDIFKVKVSQTFEIVGQLEVVIGDEYKE